MRVVPPAVLFVVALACGGEGGTTGPGKPPPGAAVASVTLAQPTGALPVGETFTLVADVRDVSGAAITGATATGRRRAR